MASVKSSAENLTLNADGSGNDILFQSNGTQVGSLTAEGVLTATSFAGSGAALTGLSSFDPDGAVTINDTGADVDFRVEGSGNANALFVQGSDGDVGIGTGTPTYPFEVRKDQNAHTIAQIWNDTAGTGASTQLRMKSNSGLGILANLDDGYSSTGMYQAGTFAMMAASTSTGGLLLATESDHPIRFLQGAAEKCRITSTGLTFGGDTAAANALDDYEEGTWTPVYTGSGGSAGGSFDYSEAEGHYTKIGRLVNIKFKYTLTNNGDWTGSVIFTGLPFANNSDTPHAGSVTLHNVNFNGSYASISIPNGVSTCRVTMTNDNSTVADVDASHVSDSAAFRATFQYHTSA